MFDWSGKNGDSSGKSQGILISCVSGNPDCIFPICGSYPYYRSPPFLVLGVFALYNPSFNYLTLLCNNQKIAILVIHLGNN